MSRDPVDLHSSVSVGRRRLLQDDALQLGPRKKPYASTIFPPRKIFRLAIHARCLSDPLIHHGRHFGRTQHALCSIRTLLKNGVFRRTELDNDGDLNVPARYLPRYIMPVSMPFALTFSFPERGENTEFSRPCFRWFLASKIASCRAPKRKFG